MIRVTPGIAIDESEIEEKFIRASGPGGQKVNKVSTAVQLRFDAAASTNLPEDVRRRLRGIAGRRMTAEGVIVIDARRYRTRQRNREDARVRLLSLLRKAARKPKARRRTKPTAASKERRLAAKRRRSEAKRLRRPLESGEQ
ncbi:MAG: alternative ribosome rescue aminoacyl-tRNA hydrolase ArfB [Planctomycetota bacterium]|jgi:ribosome-associated protein